MLRPEGTPYPWFVDFGWVGQNVPGLPGATTMWTLAQGSTLSPGQPITLTYTNGQGLNFTRTISVDANYMFTLTDTVANAGTAPVTIAPSTAPCSARACRRTPGKSGVVHKGTVGYLDGRDRSLHLQGFSPSPPRPRRSSTPRAPGPASPTNTGSRP